MVDIIQFSWKLYTVVMATNLLEAMAVMATIFLEVMVETHIEAIMEATEATVAMEVLAA